MLPPPFEALPAVWGYPNSMKTWGSERRENRRHVGKAIRMTLLDPIGRVLDEVPALKDVSMGGARVATSFKFVVGEAVRFILRFPCGNTSTGFAKVRWAAAGTEEFGLEFVDFGWGGLERLQAALEPSRAANALFSKDTAITRRLDGMLVAACFVVALTILRVAMYSSCFAHPAASRHAQRSFLGIQDFSGQVQSNVLGNE